MEKILVVDDDANHAKVVARALESKGYEITIAKDGQEGIDELEKTPYDLVLTDLMMPGVDGMGVLDHVVTHSPSTLCMILTGYATVRGAVEAIKVGAFDYITKPVSASELWMSVEKALKFKALEEENSRLKKQLKQKFTHKNIVGTSKAISSWHS